jgi:hypothetical protein
MIAYWRRERRNKTAAVPPSNSGHVVISPMLSTGGAADAKFR